MAKEFKPITSQAEMDRYIADRLRRDREKVIKRVRAAIAGIVKELVSLSDDLREMEQNA